MIMSILDYWRNSLADADRLNPNFDKMRDVAYQINDAQFKEGKIPEEITSKLFGSKMKDNQVTVAEVLLCPIIAYAKKVHGSKKGNHPDTLSPLWVPALLNKEGILFAAPRKVPWISRDYLDPCLSGVYPIGTLNVMDQFLSEKPFKEEEWNAYWQHTNEMFTEVTDMTLESFEHEQYERSMESYIMPNELMSGMTLTVQKLYDHILENKPNTKLLNQFASLKSYPPQIAITEDQSFKLSSQHLGQMGQQHALSHSQRQSIHHWLKIEEGELLALNGPPGTGKTTFLQSVISTGWIEAAVRQGEPPIMVVTSSNNQPVTNVIESFAKIQEGVHPLSGRWIPQIEGYGAYLASSRKKEEDLKPHWQTVQMGSGKKSGLLANLENLDDVSKAAFAYLEHCSLFSGQNFEEVEKAVEFLHRSLVECVDRIKQTVEVYESLLMFEAECEEQYPEGITTFKLQVGSQIQVLQTQEERNEQLLKDWVSHLNNENLLIKWLIFLPFVQKIKAKNDRQFLMLQGINQILSEEEIETYIQKERAHLQQSIALLVESCQKAEHDEEKLILYRRNWNIHEQQMISEILTYFPAESGQGIADKSPLALLDRTRRYEAFKLAAHYWEGRWILETRGMLGDPNYKQNNGEKGQQNLWRRYAKLTPCFVTTLFMLPSYFKAWQGTDHYLYGFIDMLIIDEAGQVTPEIAGASFALAKKALVVGDKLQIEPIWNIPFAIDGGNLLKFGLAENENEAFELKDLGMTASSGSVMLVAQRNTKFTLSSNDGGMWLVEHRRCVPEIIGYCNELAYHGRLEPKRISLPSYPLPHMGYAHIPGEAKKKNGSLVNEIEADAIVSWIHRNKERLIEPYVKEGVPSKSIDEVIAVITPFYQQKILILKKMAQTGLSAMKNITVGTVHALQGAERPVVIFSSVYDGSLSSSLFFDAGVNMVNVAVSRAQDSFLVFGDMRIFDPSASSPSGILARYLFVSEDQEIHNVEMPEYFRTRLGSPVEHLHDLAGHRRILAESIRSANREVHIVSPFLSSNALEADELQQICIETIQRGVRIVVYTDEVLNQRRGFSNPYFIKAKEMLISWGVEVVLTKRVHSKALWVDEDMLIEGSFNWLSAVREPDSSWCRYETSLIYRGDKVNEMIVKIQEDLTKRLLKNIER